MEEAMLETVTKATSSNQQIIRQMQQKKQWVVLKSKNKIVGE